MDDIYFCFFENLKQGHEPLFFWLACQVFRTQTWEVLKERVSELSLTEAPWLYGLSQWMALAKLHIKFALLHFNLCHISWNLNLNHNILPERGGRESDWLCKFLHTHSVHSSDIWESYLRFSELNSDSRNRRNWSRPTWSFNISSKEKPHLFTRCWLGSLLLGETKV